MSEEPTNEETPLEKALRSGGMFAWNDDEEQHWAGVIVGYRTSVVNADPPVIPLTLYSSTKDKGVVRRQDFLLTPSRASLLSLDLQRQARAALDVEGHHAE